MDTHDLRVRTSRGLLLVELHIVVDGCLSVIEGHKIAKIVEQCLSEEVAALDRVIIHVDSL
jgi:divalent metal cation (Fe/Co/Zn/Cd) transporter